LYNERKMRKPGPWKARLARELGRPEKLVVLGVGNVAKGDDAAGVRAAEALSRLVSPQICPRLKVFVGHESPENFTGAVRDFGPSHVLIIDAAAGGFPPGTVFLIDPAGIADDDVSTHRTPLSMLAGYLEKAVGCRVVILGIEPGTFVLGAPLKASVQKAVDQLAVDLAAFVCRRLRSSSASGRKYS
jgi:hydrogenase 3 maturation protease